MSVAREMRRRTTMAIDPSPLLDKAFFVEEVQNASESIERVLETFEQKYNQGARPFEVVGVDDIEDSWISEKLLHPLVYFCESEGATLPKCGGVIVALFLGDHLYGITAEDVVQWGAGVIGATLEQLDERFGTHERDTGLR
jgi:hypothetical protein